MEYSVKLLDLNDQPTLTMRSINPVEKLPQFFGVVYSAVIAYLNEIGETPAGMPFGIYYNLDMSALDVEAGFPVGRALPAKGEIIASIIPAGMYISTLHVGSYDSVQPAYDALIDWTKKNGYEPSGITYEYYLNDPSENPKIAPETEIRFPVKLIK
jgi:effector-binding domain-containing protein